MIIITDGEPRRINNRQKTYGEKYKNNNNNGELLLANDMAEEIKNKGITVVGLAVGNKIKKSTIKQWSSENAYFKANFDSLTSIIGNLINATCIDPGENRGNIDQRQFRTLIISVQKYDQLIQCNINRSVRGWILRRLRKRWAALIKKQ